MFPNALKGYFQYFKVVFLGEFRLLRFINITHQGKKLCFPFLIADSFFKKALQLDSSCPGCLLGASPMKYVMLKNDAGCAIYCNSALLKTLEEDEQKAVILHEVGHYVLKHRDCECENEKEEQAREREADSFACAHGFARPLLSAMEKLLNFYDGPNLMARIAGIRERIGCS